MPEPAKSEAAKPETPASDIITALGNRINGLDADLAALKKAQKAPDADKSYFDGKIAELLKDITELKTERAAVRRQESTDKKEQSLHDDTFDGLDYLDLSA